VIWQNHLLTKQISEILLKSTKKYGKCKYDVDTKSVALLRGSAYLWQPDTELVLI